MPKMERAGTGVAARVFKATEHFISTQAVTGGVNRLGDGVRKLFEPAQLWVANKPFASGHPPLSLLVLEHILIPAPSWVDDSLRQSKLNGGESVAIETIDESLNGAATKQTKLDGTVC